MRYIEPHGHMVSRVTDDYVDMISGRSFRPTRVTSWSLWQDQDQSNDDDRQDSRRNWPAHLESALGNRFVEEVADRRS